MRSMPSAEWSELSSAKSESSRVATEVSLRQNPVSDLSPASEPQALGSTDSIS